MYAGGVRSERVEESGPSSGDARGAEEGCGVEWVSLNRHSKEGRSRGVPVPGTEKDTTNKDSSDLGMDHVIACHLQQTSYLLT